MPELKIINIKTVIEQVAKLFVKANLFLDESVKQKYAKAIENESNENAKNFLKLLQENYKIAETEKVPLCQDTGLAVLFVNIGQNVFIEGGSLTKAINSGVEQGFKQGNLRASVVNDPLFERKNTNSSAPAIIHYNIVEGDKLEINLMAKGGGAENKSRLKMFNPSATENDIINFILETAKIAGPDACPPYYIGVGIGGNFEQCAILAKKALLDTDYNPDDKFKNLEQKAEKTLNQSQIGAMGLGGNNTVFSVRVLAQACHIASMPVAVNINCHSTRHVKVIL